MSASDSAVTVLGESTRVDQPGSAGGLRASTVAHGHHTPGAIQQLAQRQFDQQWPPVDQQWAAVEDLGGRFRDIRLLSVQDAIIALFATALAASHAGISAGPSNTSELIILIAGTLAWPLGLAAARGYRRANSIRPSAEFGPVFVAGTALIVVSALLATWLGLDRVLTLVGTAVPVAVLGSLAARRAHLDGIRRAIRRGEGLQRSIIVGSPESVLEFARALPKRPDVAISVAGVCVPAADTERAVDLGLPVVGDLEHVAAAATSLGCGSVVVAGIDNAPAGFVRQLAWSLEDHGSQLILFPGLTDLAKHRVRVETRSNLPLLHLEQPRFSGWRRRAKRATDLALTSVGLVFAAPLLGLIALAIKIDDRGPVIFRQVRVGIDGRRFTIYKFRSMVVDAERRLAELTTQNEGAGPLFKIERDPRITRIGHILRRFSLDELPQLFNIMAGSMSLVGPRPPLPTEVERYEPHVHRRMKVLPGLTGPWQVGGRSLLTWEETVRLDLGYVENWSLGLDLMILFKTVRTVLGRVGAF